MSPRSRLRAGRRCARARRPAQATRSRRRRRPSGIAPGLVALRGQLRCRRRTGGRRSPRAERATSVAPAGHENEAPEIAAQRSEPGQRLRKAVLDEPRPCAPGLHQRAHVVGRSTSEEHERRIRKERVEICDHGGSSPASCRRSASRASHRRSSDVDVLALARRDVRRASARPSPSRDHCGWWNSSQRMCPSL